MATNLWGPGSGVWFEWEKPSISLGVVILGGAYLGSLGVAALPHCWFVIYKEMMGTHRGGIQNASGEHWPGPLHS